MVLILVFFAAMTGSVRETNHEAGELNEQSRLGRVLPPVTDIIQVPVFMADVCEAGAVEKKDRQEAPPQQTTPEVPSPEMKGPALQGRDENVETGTAKEGTLQGASRESTAQGKGSPGGRSLSWIIIAAVILVCMVLIPIMPGIMELKRPRDNKALGINMNFSKDHKYFGRSFKEILDRGLGTEKTVTPGVYTIALSKPEAVRVVLEERIPDQQKIDQIYYLANDCVSGSGVKFQKEVYAKGNINIGKNSSLRALYSEGDITIEENTKILRWIVGDRSISISEGCELGLSVSGSAELSVSRNCTFSRLYGMPFCTYRVEKSTLPPDGSLAGIDDTAIVLTKDEIVIPPYTTLTSDIVARGTLRLREGCTVQAAIKAYENVYIENNARLTGDVFGEKDVVIGEGCVIAGNVFSQGNITIEQGSEVGNPSVVKSVIAKKSITIAGNVKIYGYIMTEGEGLIQ